MPVTSWSGTISQASGFAGLSSLMTTKPRARSTSVQSAPLRIGEAGLHRVQEAVRVGRAGRLRRGARRAGGEGEEEDGKRPHARVAGL